jgi:hypothetical protein
MDDMRALTVMVAIIGIVAIDIAFNNSAILSWIGTQLGLH